MVIEKKAEACFHEQMDFRVSCFKMMDDGGLMMALFILFVFVLHVS